MKRFRNFIAKHYEDISWFGVFSLFLVGESSPIEILMYSPVPITLFAIGYWGKRINDRRRKRKEL